MSKSHASTLGKVVWYDLMTSDREKALDFYTKLFGWEIEYFESSDCGKYPMWKHADKHLGGAMSLPEDEDVPSHWITYVTVADVDVTLEKIKELGGQVCVPATDIPNIGRFAVITDPQGAVISPYTCASLEEQPESAQPVAGQFCWTELSTPNPDGARDFYTAIFGWDSRDMPMGEAGTYTIFRRGEKDESGMMPTPVGCQAPANWLPYIAVDNTDSVTAAARELGAQVHVEPQDIPDVGRFAVIADPTGASFGIITLKAK
ncbi:MAG: VOC family protein [bacterium]